MECNKDEAARAKDMAERKFLERNYSGAKKFVVKATNLYPDLEGLAQMSSTLDVYISAESKIAGESDWYGVLEVSPLADDDLIRKQYRRFALALHPDKNKAVGGQGAFKMVSEAWALNYKIKLEFPEEYIVNISGRFGEFNGFKVIRSLTITTNKRKYGPYGTEDGTKFDLPMSGGSLVVGFHGRGEGYLDSIGVRVSPLQSSKHELIDIGAQKNSHFENSTFSGNVEFHT